MPALGGLRDRGQLVAGLDLAPHLEEVTAGAELLHVLAHDRVPSLAGRPAHVVPRPLYARAVDVSSTRPAV